MDGILIRVVSNIGSRNLVSRRLNEDAVYSNFLETSEWRK